MGDHGYAKVLPLLLEEVSDGVDVVLARTVPQALDAISTSGFDLMYFHAELADDLGIRFIEEVRSAPQGRFTRMIAATPTTLSDAEELTLYRAGYDAVLQVPFSAQTFFRCVARLLHVAKEPRLALLRLGVETPNLDYKAAVDLSTKDGSAALAKDIIAMANSGGGSIFCGVSEVEPGKFKWIGVSQDHLHKCETSILNRAIARYLDPVVNVEVHQIEDSGLSFLQIEVPPALDTLILVRKENESANLRFGRVYHRSSAAESVEVRRSSDLRVLLDRIVQQKHNRFLDRLPERD